MCERDEIIVIHNQKFGEERANSLAYCTTLVALTRNVGVWKNSGAREMILVDLRDNMDALYREDLKQTVRTLSEMSKVSF